MVICNRRLKLCVVKGFRLNSEKIGKLKEVELRATCDEQFMLRGIHVDKPRHHWAWGSRAAQSQRPISSGLFPEPRRSHSRPHHQPPGSARHRRILNGPHQGCEA